MASPTRLPDRIPQITDLLDRLTTDAAALPGRSDLQFHRTLDRGFARELDGASARVLGLTDELVRLVRADDVQASAGSSGQGLKRQKTNGAGGVKEAVARVVKEEEDVTEDFRRTIGAALDTLLEDADKRLDEASGAIKAARVAIDPKKAAQASRKLPGPFAEPLPVTGSTSASKWSLPYAMRNAELLKPQLDFPDAPDNTPFRPFRPSLSAKPHAMVPLSYVPSPLPPFSDPLPHTSTPPTPAELDRVREYKRAYERYKRAVRERAHPYWYETEHLQYPTRMFEVAPPIPPELGVGEENVASGSASGGKEGQRQEVVFVDTDEALEAMVEELKGVGEMAVDLEYHATRSYYGFTCLMQISSRTRDWVVDTLKLRGAIRRDKLGGVLADPGIVKVFHGAGSDITWLQQDFDLYVVNLFDTYHATHVLGFKAHSLASLLARYTTFTPDKRYQLADWRIRPLPPAMLEYARSDTHFLLYIYDHLRNSLLEIASRPSSPAPHAPGLSSSTTSPTSPTSPTAAAAAASTVARSHAPRTGTPETNPQRALREVLALSAETALTLYEKDDYDPVTGRGTSGWKVGRKKHLPAALYSQVEGMVFVRVHQWRDRVARERDESPHYILPNLLIRSIALQPVPSLTHVRRIVTANGNAQRVAAIGARDDAEEIHAVVLAAREEYGGMSVSEIARVLQLGDGRDSPEAMGGVGTPGVSGVSGLSGTATPATPATSAMPAELEKTTATTATMTAAAAAAAATPKAKAKTKAKSKSPASPAPPAPPIITDVPVADRLARFDELWSGVSASASAAAPVLVPESVNVNAVPEQGEAGQPKTTAIAKKAKGGSALFGKTLSTGSLSAAPEPASAPASASVPQGKQAAPKQKAQSGLFGETIKGKAAPGPGPGPTSTPASVPADRAALFEAVRLEIAADLGMGMGMGSVGDQSTVSVSASATATTAQEQQKSPQGQTGTDRVDGAASGSEWTAGDATEGIPAPEPAPAPALASPAVAVPKPKKKDTVVQVKKTKTRKAKAKAKAGAAAEAAEAAGAAAGESGTEMSNPALSVSGGGEGQGKGQGHGEGKDTTADASATNTAPAPSPAPAPKLKSKSKSKTPSKPVDIPEFDYSLQPDILSGATGGAGGPEKHGQAQGQAQTKSKKDRKKEKRDKAKGPPSAFIETPDFGPRPRDMTAPKAGARSHTFAQ